ncbi:MAG TPA: phosphoenolpyruvate--protein phosphotransferase [Gemmatimonadales bacterium]|nr:phosphoenolpyruvate--protein phosphotransferase [Gemmatimonadales bacterium]
MSGGRRLKGVGVSPGVAYAPAVTVRWDLPDVPDRAVTVDQVDGEVVRLREAVAETVRALDQLRQRVLERAGPEESRIFEAQMMLAQDEDFLRSVEHLIRKNRLSAETAYEFKSLELRNLWASSPSTRLRDRLADLGAIQIRMLAHLTGKAVEAVWSGPSDGAEQVIVVAHELSPGLTVQLDRDHVVGLVSEEGTRTSHAAILAHSLGIPAVMGAVAALDRIAPGTMVLLDGQSGTLVLDPSPAELEEARARLSRRQKTELELEAAVSQPAESPDGHRYTLLSNVDLPEEIQPALRHGAMGVGLLRTEFLVTGRTHLPSEDEQYAYFRRVADAFGGKPVVIRSFDLGGDKFPVAFHAPHEANPFLGWRSIRVCLDEPDIFRPQLRAVLRAAADRDIRLMLPLVTEASEVTETKRLLAEEAGRLAAEGVRAAASVPVGVMIETPAAVALADQLAAVSAFFSVGSNDLTQYTLAVDRGNARLAERFNPHHPAVVRQLVAIARAGDAAGIPVSVCGEMASEPLTAVLLAGLGYSALSVGPPALPLVKWVLRSVPRAVAQAAATEALTATSPDEVLDLLRRATDPYLARH